MKYWRKEKSTWINCALVLAFWVASEMLDFAKDNSCWSFACLDRLCRNKSDGFLSLFLLAYAVSHFRRSNRGRTNMGSPSVWPAFTVTFLLDTVATSMEVGHMENACCPVTGPDRKQSGGGFAGPGRGCGNGGCGCWSTGWLPLQPLQGDWERKARTLYMALSRRVVVGIFRHVRCSLCLTTTSWFCKKKSAIVQTVFESYSRFAISSRLLEGNLPNMVWSRLAFIRALLLFVFAFQLRVQVYRFVFGSCLGLSEDTRENVILGELLWLV